MILEDATIHRLIIDTVKAPIERGEGISPQDWIKFARTIEEMTIAALQRARTLTATDAQPSPGGQWGALDEVACDLPYLFGRASLEGHEAGQRLAKEVQAKMRAALSAPNLCRSLNLHRFKDLIGFAAWQAIQLPETDPRRDFIRQSYELIRIIDSVKEISK